MLYGGFSPHVGRSHWVSGFSLLCSVSVEGFYFFFAQDIRSGVEVQAQRHEAARKHPAGTYRCPASPACQCHGRMKNIIRNKIKACLQPVQDPPASTPVFLAEVVNSILHSFYHLRGQCRHDSFPPVILSWVKNRECFVILSR